MQARHFDFWPKGVPKQLALPETTLYYNLEVSAARYPNKHAISYYGASMTYGELKAQAEQLAGFLQQDCGVKKGDRVILDMQNSPQFVIAYYAILRADAVVVPVNPMNLTEELKHYVGDSGARVAICGQELFPRIGPLLGQGQGQGLDKIIVANYGEYVADQSDPSVPDFIRLPTQNPNVSGVSMWRDALAAKRAPAPAQAKPDDMCAMPYTSGTTGKPKGCIHTHRTLMATASLYGVWSGGTPEDSSLAVVPFFHITGMQVLMNAPIYIGSKMVIMTRWDRELAAKLIAKEKVTTWTNIPTMVIDLLGSPNVNSFDFSSLRSIGGGGAAMPEAVAKRLFELTGLKYMEGYGLTETAAPTHSNPTDNPKRQCLGIPILNTESYVVNPDTLEEMPQGEVGEIISHGPQVFKGYWNNPDATKGSFVPFKGKQFFRTGDLGRIDDEGYFFIVDRLKRMINASGYKVWPAEVELMMFAHPAVQEACVIAAQDAHRGETVKAIVVLKDAHKGKVSEQQVIDWCKDNMAAYKYPRIVEFADMLPKTATGKVQWRLLQEKEQAKA